MKTSGRIFFKDNPYPNGHEVKDFNWSGRLDAVRGLWFDFHLQTDDYYAEDRSSDDEDIEPESDWKARIVWGNYHRCTMSSTYWHQGGILIGIAEDKFDLENIESKTIRADALPLASGWEYDDLSFHIYLLGHDSCADHAISFTRKGNDNRFDILWTGKIALTYAGSDEFKHEFEANIENVEFEGFDVPEEISELSETEKLLEKFVINKEIYEIQRNIIRIK